MSSRRVAMISGGARGIGAAIGRELVDRGWTVSLGLRRPEMPDWARGLAQEALHRHPYNATDAATGASWAGAVADRFGRIDAVVASAGIMVPGPALAADDGAFQELLEVNVKAPRRLVMAAWPWLKAAGHGRVMILGSLSGKRVKSANSGLYAISKFAAVGLAHAIRHEGFAHGIRATAVCPGLVATDMGTPLTDLPAAALTDPADLARIVAMLIELPDTASVAEFCVNCQLEESY